MTPEQMAQAFHESYERLAPSFGYETRRESAVPWENVPENNRALMTAVCAEVTGDAMLLLADAMEALAALTCVDDWINDFGSHEFEAAARLLARFAALAPKEET